jgi:hypothetical protein
VQSILGTWQEIGIPATLITANKILEQSAYCDKSTSPEESSFPYDSTETPYSVGHTSVVDALLGYNTWSYTDVSSESHIFLLKVIVTP